MTLFAPASAPSSLTNAGPVAWVGAASALIRRDVLLLVRRPSRIAATVLTPALLWAFFASGFSETVAAAGGVTDAGDAYTRSLAAGSGLLVATFASIFGALGLIRDRETGYLQAVLVGPTPRWVIISARVLSGGLFAFLQAATMLAAASVLSEGVSLTGAVVAGAMLAFTAVGLSGFCTALAWHFRSIEGFHGVMSGVLMPAWMLSGAVFPPGAGRDGLIGLVMQLNPLAYTHSATAGALGAADAGAAAFVGTAVFGLAGPIAAVAAARGDARR